MKSNTNSDSLDSKSELNHLVKMFYCFPVTVNIGTFVSQGCCPGTAPHILGLHLLLVLK